MKDILTGVGLVLAMFISQMRGHVFFWFFYLIGLLLCHDIINNQNKLQYDNKWLSE